MKRKFLGLDLSLTNTGWAILNNEGDEIVAGGIIKPKERRGIERLEYIEDEIKLVLKNHNPLFIAIEGYSFGSRLGKSNAVFGIGELGGVARLCLYKEGRDWIDIAPTVLKKYVTGTGNAKKDIVIKEVFRKWKFDTNNNNVADAYSLSQMARTIFKIRTGKMKIDDLLRYEQEALKKIDLEG